MRRIGAAVLLSAVATASANATTVVDWNDTLAQLTREHPGSGPGWIARSGAMMNVAIYNAVNAVDQTHQPYAGFALTSGPGTSREAAAAVAAHGVLISSYPAAQHAAINNLLDAQLGAIPDGPAKTAGIALGQQAANHVLALRSSDGSDASMSYTPGTNPGDWVPTQPGDPVHPQWGQVTPWGITSGDQFRSNRLASYGTLQNFLESQEYADNYNGNESLGIPGVKDLGRIDAWTPADEEYQIAFFWANDRDGTYKPLGHLNEITSAVANQQFAGLSESERLSQEARLFALSNVAMADAGIAAWDCKFQTEFDLWRPITAIQNAHLDGNDQTAPDATWEPLNHVDPDDAGPETPDPFSPQFPAWVSGHATFSAAHAAALAAFFGTDDISFTVGTDDPYLPDGYTRTFSSFSDAAWENALSRIYLGVHWYIDGLDGNIMGHGVGDFIAANYFQAIPAPGPTGLLAGAGLLSLRRRRRR